MRGGRAARSAAKPCSSRAPSRPPARPLVLCTCAVRILMLAIFAAHRDWVPPTTRPAGNLEGVQVRRAVRLGSQAEDGRGVLGSQLGPRSCGHSRGGKAHTTACRARCACCAGGAGHYRRCHASLLLADPLLQQVRRPPSRCCSPPPNTCVHAPAAATGRPARADVPVHHTPPGTIPWYHLQVLSILWVPLSHGAHCGGAHAAGGRRWSREEPGRCLRMHSAAMPPPCPTPPCAHACSTPHR